jgi:hypothetical protein
MSYLYRCNKTIKNGAAKGERCGTRHSLPMKVEQYIIKPKCLCCGAELSYIDKWQRNKNRDKSNLCECDGLYFSIKGSPHRKGSKWCNHYEGEYTEEELQERYQT